MTEKGEGERVSSSFFSIFLGTGGESNDVSKLTRIERLGVWMTAANVIGNGG